jgi:hypothetical protein
MPRFIEGSSGKPQRAPKPTRPKTPKEEKQFREYQLKGLEARRQKMLPSAMLPYAQMGAGKSAIPPLRYEETVPLSMLPPRSRTGMVISTVASIFKRAELAASAVVGFAISTAMLPWAIRQVRREWGKVYKFMTKNRRKNKALGWISKYKGRIAAGAAVGAAVGVGGYMAKKYADKKAEENLMPSDVLPPQGIQAQ